MTSKPTEATLALPTVAERRKRLKQNLFRSRAIDGGKPTCCICGKPVSTGGEMHEVFLTRGDVQKMDDFIARQIFAAENCVILCSQECHIVAATETGKRSCTAQLLLYEGFFNIDSFLYRQSKFWKGTGPEIERRYLRTIMQFLTGEPGGQPSSLPEQPKRVWQSADFK